MSQIIQKYFKTWTFLIVLLPNTVNAWDWGDFHKFAVVFFTILGFGLGFVGILIVFYFGFMKNCLRKHQEDVLHTHRAFHPWPPGSVQWERQRTYRASTGRSMGQEEIQYQYGTSGHPATNIPYNTLSNQPYDAKETYQHKPLYQPTKIEQQNFSTGEYPKNLYNKESYFSQTTSAPENHYPSHTHITTTTHFSPPEACAYNTPYQKLSPFPTTTYQAPTSNIQQSPYITYSQSPYPEGEKKLFNQQVQSLSPHYSYIQKEATSLRRSLSPNSKLSQMIRKKSENVIVRNTTLVNNQQSSTSMDTHTYI